MQLHAKYHFNVGSRPHRDQLGRIRNNLSLIIIPEVSKHIVASPQTKSAFFQILNGPRNWCQISHRLRGILHKTHECPSFTRRLRRLGIL